MLNAINRTGLMGRFVETLEEVARLREAALADGRWRFLCLPPRDRLGNAASSAKGKLR